MDILRFSLVYFRTEIVCRLQVLQRYYVNNCVQYSTSTGNILVCAMQTVANFNQN